MSIINHPLQVETPHQNDQEAKLESSVITSANPVNLPRSCLASSETFRYRSAPRRRRIKAATEESTPTSTNKPRIIHDRYRLGQNRTASCLRSRKLSLLINNEQEPLVYDSSCGEDVTSGRPDPRRLGPDVPKFCREPVVASERPLRPSTSDRSEHVEYPSSGTHTSVRSNSHSNHARFSSTQSSQPVTVNQDSGSPSSVSSISRPSRVCSVVFFDLDDTLIPTEWVRRAFVVIRDRRKEARRSYEAQLPSSSALLKRLWTVGFGTPSDTDSKKVSSLPVTVDEAMSQDMQAEVRGELERLGGVDFDERAARLIEHACQVFGVVVIVTNARSAAWLQIASSLFPCFKAQLRRFSVPIIRAASSSCQSLFLDPVEYFQYWTNLKKTQFRRVVAATLKILISLKRHATGLPNPDDNTDIAPLVTGDIFAVGSFEEACSAMGAPHTENGSQDTGGQFEELLARPQYLQSILMSPRSHTRESREVEEILQRTDSWILPLDPKSLSRVITHQVRRFILHQHSIINPAIARLPYNPHHVLGSPYENAFYFPPNIGTLRFTAFARAPVRQRIPANRENHKTILDVVCVGDSEFELCAARELANTYPRVFHGCGLIKCKTGLPPGLFRLQLDQIESALYFVQAARWDESVAATGLAQFGATVLAEYTSKFCRFQTCCIGISAEQRNERLLSQLALLTNPFATPGEEAIVNEISRHSITLTMDEFLRPNLNTTQPHTDGDVNEILCGGYIDRAAANREQEHNAESR